MGGLANMALPFYIIFATDRLGFAADNIGLFVSAQVLGGLLAGTLLGYLSERSGSKAVIMAALAIQMAAPLLALGVFAAGGTLGALGPWVYALVFVAVGVGQSSGILGFINYVLELAEPRQRVTYVGLTNTLYVAALDGVRLDLGITLDAQLLSLEVTSVEQTKDEMRVCTNERWRYRDRKIGTGEQVGEESLDSYEMLYVLRKIDRAWLVDEIQFASPPQVGRKQTPWIADRQQLLQNAAPHIDSRIILGTFFTQQFSLTTDR